MAKSQAGSDSSIKKKESAGYAFKFSDVEESPKTRSRDQRANLEQLYLDQVVAALREEFEYPNRIQVPRLSKIVLNIGLGEALKQPKLLEQTFESLGHICGQRPVVTRARKSIAGFKLREGMKLGCMVTLRRDKMWDFLEKLLMVALPRTRDFRGVSRKAFDGRGNYTLGVRELLIFPEVDIDKLTYVPGMNICIHTTARNDEEGRSLLTRLGMPFRET